MINYVFVTYVLVFVIKVQPDPTDFMSIHVPDRVGQTPYHSVVILHVGTCMIVVLFTDKCHINLWFLYAYFVNDVAIPCSLCGFQVCFGDSRSS